MLALIYHVRKDVSDDAKRTLGKLQISLIVEISGDCGAPWE